jgi:N-acetylglucosaminyldiphosphoundecaprenol N-acetyl-beta-D-mannosaminyltransferase
MMMEILGVKYHNVSFAQAVESAGHLFTQERKSVIFFLNLDCLSKAVKDPEYRNILNDATLVLPDGVGLKVATRLFGGMMRENCNGTDISPVLMKAAAKEGWPIYFLGGKEGVAQRAAENVRNFIPGIKIVGSHSGYFSDEEKVIKAINDSGAAMLFVAFGAPLQEKWIARNRQKLNPKVCLGVGALLDYMSGEILRAPRTMQMLHLEWLWRVFIDPKRMFQRYIINGFGFMFYLTFMACKTRLTAKP